MWYKPLRAEKKLQPSHLQQTKMFCHQGESSRYYQGVKLEQERKHLENPASKVVSMLAHKHKYGKELNLLPLTVALFVSTFAH